MKRFLILLASSVILSGSLTSCLILEPEQCKYIDPETGERCKNKQYKTHDNCEMHYYEVME